MGKMGLIPTLKIASKLLVPLVNVLPQSFKVLNVFVKLIQLTFPRFLGSAAIREIVEL